MQQNNEVQNRDKTAERKREKRAENGERESGNLIIEIYDAYQNCSALHCCHTAAATDTLINFKGRCTIYIAYYMKQRRPRQTIYSITERA